MILLSWLLAGPAAAEDKPSDNKAEDQRAVLLGETEPPKPPSPTMTVPLASADLPEGRIVALGDIAPNTCTEFVAAGADFVKTSTGFSKSGATAEDVALMHSIVHDAGMEVKASGGIRTLDDARRMIAAGATRIGASAGVQIVAGDEGDDGVDRY